LLLYFYEQINDDDDDTDKRVEVGDLVIRILYVVCMQSALTGHSGGGVQRETRTGELFLKFNILAARGPDSS